MKSCCTFQNTSAFSVRKFQLLIAVGVQRKISKLVFYQPRCEFSPTAAIAVILRKTSQKSE